MRRRLFRRMVMKLVTGDDWQQLFVDGKLLTENHILDAHDFIEALSTLPDVEAFVIEEEEYYYV